MAQLEIKNLSFSYPEGGETLKNINLSVDAGEFLLIVGASGCGKTTLLRHIKPVLRPRGKLKGEILMNGKAVSDMDFRAQSEDIGFVMQDPEMQIVTDKVWHELAFGLENLGTDLRAMRVRIAETACFFGIQDWFYKDVNTLSGGQKQLLCLAGVTVMRPKIILLDEPTSQIDPIAANGFFDMLKRVNTELGTTVIITEHRTENLFPIADRVAFMKDGEIKLCCKPNEAAFALKNDRFFCPALPAAAYLYSCLENRDTAKKNPSENISGEPNYRKPACKSETRERTAGAPERRISPVSVREGREYLKALLKESAFDGKKWDTGKETPEKERGQSRKDGSDFDEKCPVLVSLKDVWFRYERNSEDVLRGLCLNIPKGKLTCVVGGNGAGKTTALLTAAGVYKPYRGKVKFADEIVRADEAVRADGAVRADEAVRADGAVRAGRIGCSGKKRSAGKHIENRPDIAVLTQNPRLGFKQDTVRAELENAARKYAAGEERLAETVKLMEIEEILDRHPYDVSGGEIQRAAIAKLLLGKPKALFLDEATKGMDAYFKGKFGILLKRLAASGMTIALVSHDIEFCAEFADNCVMFFNGAVTASGTPKQLFSDNAFYTTAANRIARGIIENAVSVSDIVSAITEHTAAHTVTAKHTAAEHTAAEHTAAEQYETVTPPKQIQ